MFAEVLGIVTPAFVIAAIGYIWVRFDQPFDNATVSSLVMMIGSPCLIFSALTRNTPDVAMLTQVAGVAIFAIVAGLVIAGGILRLFGWKMTTFLPSMVHANSGNLGLPLVLLAFGETGLALGMAYFFVNSISQFTLGLSIASGTFHPLQLLKQPVVWSVALVLLVIFGGVQVPAWISATTEILGGITIPAMLLLLGTSLARLNVAAMRQTFTVSVLRLVMGFGLASAAILIFELDGIIAGVVLIQGTMPTAVFNYIFAERFNREPDKVAAVVLQSSLLSVATLPFLVAYALTL